MTKNFSKTEDGRGDISKAQDLIMAVTNLISLEEHLIFTAAKVGENDYYEISRAVRKIRIFCLRELIGDPKGELWCASKHTLSAMMRLLEVASKEEGEKCRQYLNAAFDLYQLFWLYRESGEGLEMGKHGTEIEKSKNKV